MDIIIMGPTPVRMELTSSLGYQQCYASTPRIQMDTIIETISCSKWAHNGDILYWHAQNSER
eukprot:6796859-Ditylum_brightwellii.AAC.1